MDEMRDAEIGSLLSGGSVAEHAADHWKGLEAAVAPELAALQPPRPRRRPVVRMALAAAALAVAAIVAFAVLPALRGTDAATAADMLASMSRSFGDVRAVRLRVVEHKTTSDLILSTNGDFRVSQATEGPRRPGVWPGETPTRPGLYGYDASRHELRMDSLVTGDGVVVLRPSLPTQVPAPAQLSYLTYQDAAYSVRAALAESDSETPVEETTYLGRPAWTVSLSYHDWHDLERRVTVDQATGLLMAMDIVDAKRGTRPPVPFLHVTRLEADSDLPAGWEVVPLLKKTRTLMRWNYFNDEGTRFGSPQSVARLSAPTPVLTPQWVPSGYRRSAVATAVLDDLDARNWNENSHRYEIERVEPHGSTPGTVVSRRVALRRCRQQVSVLFRRGFDTFTITVSPRLPGEGLVEGRSDEVPNAQVAALTGGYLKGATALCWLSSADYHYRSRNRDITFEGTLGPTLLAYDDHWKVVISGGLTRRELVDVANSLMSSTVPMVP